MKHNSWWNGIFNLKNKQTEPLAIFTIKAKEYEEKPEKNFLLLPRNNDHVKTDAFLKLNHSHFKFTDLG